MAYACNMDKIASNKMSTERDPHVRRRRGPALKPAEDLIDMADRIYALCVPRLQKADIADRKLVGVHSGHGRLHRDVRFGDT